MIDARNVLVKKIMFLFVSALVVYMIGKIPFTPIWLLSLMNLGVVVTAAMLVANDKFWKSDQSSNEEKLVQSEQEVGNYRLRCPNCGSIHRSYLSLEGTLNRDPIVKQCSSCNVVFRFKLVESFLEDETSILLRYNYGHVAVYLNTEILSLDINRSEDQYYYSTKSNSYGTRIIKKFFNPYRWEYVLDEGGKFYEFYCTEAAGNAVQELNDKLGGTYKSFEKEPVPKSKPETDVCVWKRIGNSTFTMSCGCMLNNPYVVSLADDSEYCYRCGKRVKLHPDNAKYVRKDYGAKAGCCVF